MKVQTANLIVAAIPCGLLCLSVILTNAHGPYYLRNNFDPEYCYLLNSLNLLTFHSPAHTDHPGTTLQVIGAAAVWFRWLFIRVPGQSLSESVLSDPEQYLRTINVVLNVLLGGALFWASRRIYQLSKSLTAAMLLQGTILIYHETILALTRVSPEPLLIATGLALMTQILPMVLGGVSGRDENRLAIFAGAIFGFGVITKLTFIPWAAVILLFPGRSAKLRFGAAFLGTATLLILPVIARFKAMALWFRSLLIHTGRYGQGSVGIPGAGVLRANVLGLWRGESPLFLLLGLYFLVWLWLVMAKRKRIAETKTLIGLLVVACLAIGAQVIIVVKSPVARYLLPALVATALVNPVLYLVLRQSASIPPIVRQLCPVVAATFILVGLGRNGLYFEWWMEATRVDQRNISAVRNVENTLSGCQLIGSYRSSLQSYAISFGSSYSGNVHSPILNKLYPGTISYNTFTRKFRSFTGILNPDSIRRMIFDGQCVVVEGGSLDGDIARQNLFHADDVRFTPLITTANPILPASATFLYRLDPAPAGR